LKIALARITPTLGANARDIEKNFNDWKCLGNTRGHKKNSQSLKVPKQSWGHEEKSKGSKNFEQKKNQYDMLKTKWRKQKQRERAQA